MLHPLKARVKNGQFVLDDPSTDLPEGTEVELMVVDDEFEPEERARLLQAIDEGLEDMERGDCVDGFELIAQLRAKRGAASHPDELEDEERASPQRAIDRGLEDVEAGRVIGEQELWQRLHKNRNA